VGFLLPFGVAPRSSLTSGATPAPAVATNRRAVSGSLSSMDRPCLPPMGDGPAPPAGLSSLLAAGGSELSR
jgi:hypothetical protein